MLLLSLLLASVEFYRLSVIFLFFFWSKTKLITHSKPYINVASHRFTGATWAYNIFFQVIFVSCNSAGLFSYFKTWLKNCIQHCCSQQHFTTGFTLLQQGISQTLLGQIVTIWYLKFRLCWLIRIGYISCSVFEDWKNLCERKSSKKPQDFESSSES